jgi:leucyl-tRNA synthetase
LSTAQAGAGRAAGGPSGLPYSIHQQAWPTYDEQLLAQAAVTVVVQVNGRVRDQLQVPAAEASDEARLRERALGLPRVQQLTAGQTVRKVIVVSGRLVNVVAN